MPDPRHRPTAEPAAPPGGDGQDSGEPAAGSRQRKKRDKVRSAWIAFVGRIVAQIVGGAVTVGLTLFLIQRAQQPRSDAAADPLGEPAATTAAAPLVSGPDLLPGAAVDATPTEIAIAVLPLANYSGDAGQDHFAELMTEALIAELAQLKEVRVVSRTSSMRYRGSRQTVPEIARELDVTHIVEGSVVRDRTRVRITAQMIDAASDRHLWAGAYDRRDRDVLAIQAEVAAAIAREIGGTIVSIETAPRPRRQEDRFEQMRRAPDGPI